jgi:hypothetical protein
MSGKDEVKSLDCPNTTELDDRIIKFHLEDGLVVTSTTQIIHLAKDSDLIRTLLQEQKDEIELKLSLTESEWNHFISHYTLMRVDYGSSSLSSRAKMIITAYYLGASSLIASLSSSMLCGINVDSMGLNELDHVYRIITDKNIMMNINDVDKLIFGTIYSNHSTLLSFIFDLSNPLKQNRIIEYLIRLRYDDLLMKVAKPKLLCLNHLKHSISHNNLVIFKYIIDNIESVETMIVMVQEYMNQLRRYEMLLYIFDKAIINTSSLFIYIQLIKHSPEILQKLICNPNFSVTIKGKEFNMTKLTFAIINASNDDLELFKIYESFCKGLDVGLGIVEEMFYLTPPSNNAIVTGWFDTHSAIAAVNSPVSPPNMSSFPNIFQYIIVNYVKQPDQINITSDETVNVLRDKSNYISFIQFIGQDIIDEKSSVDTDEYAPDDYLMARHWGKGLPQYAIYEQYHKFSDYERGLKILPTNEHINEMDNEHINEVEEPLFAHPELINLMNDFDMDLDEKSSIIENSLTNETLDEMNRIISEYTTEPQLDIIDRSINDSDEKYNDEKEPEIK